MAETTALIAAQSEPAAPIEETIEQRLAKLETLLSEARTGNLKVPIETPDGPRDYKAVRDEHREYLDMMALSTESSRVQREEIERRSHAATYGTEWHPDGYASKPLLTEDQAVQLFGLSKWNGLTPQQRAQAKTITQAMVDRVELAKCFGRASSGARAMELSSQNPTLYRLAKKKAQREGLL